MGQSNAAVRQWMGNPKRFADLFNATVFNGEQVIQPEELGSTQVSGYCYEVEERRSADLIGM